MSPQDMPRGRRARCTITRVAAPERFSVFATIAPLAGWRRALALDRRGDAPRPVVLSFVPETVVDDATRFAAVVRDVEAAARLQHSGSVPVLGLETVGEALAIVEPYRTGATLRALLASGGRLPSDVAARIVADACAGIVHAHTLHVDDGLPLVHGALEPGRLSVGRDGGVAVGGFGMAGFASIGDDVRGLGAILYECLAGEAPSEPPRALDVPGVPAALAAAVSRAIGASPGEPFASVEALAEAIAAAVPLASQTAVASYAEAILPAGEGRRAELLATLEGVRPPPRGEAELISEDLIVDPTSPSALPSAVSGGLAVGSSSPAAKPLGGSEARTRSSGEPAAVADAVEPTSPAVQPAAIPADEPLALSRPAPDAATVFPAPPPIRRRSLAPFLVASVCAVSGFAIGFVASRLVPGAFAEAPPPAIPAAAPAPDGFAPAPAAAPSDAQTSRTPAPVRKPAKAAKAARRAADGEKGTIDVTAPAGAEVFVDGRSVGKGSVKVPVVEGDHRVEVRLGDARVGERLTVAAGETRTYTVTPTVAQ